MAETECGPNDCGLCCQKVKSVPVRVPGGFTYLCAGCTREAVSAWAGAGSAAWADMRAHVQARMQVDESFLAEDPT